MQSPSNARVCAAARLVEADQNMCPTSTDTDTARGCRRRTHSIPWQSPPAEEREMEKSWEVTVIPHTTHFSSSLRLYLTHGMKQQIAAAFSQPPPITPTTATASKQIDPIDLSRKSSGPDPVVLARQSPGEQQ